jgi:hypothetical protein
MADALGAALFWSMSVCVQWPRIVDQVTAMVVLPVAENHDPGRPGDGESE